MKRILKLQLVRLEKMEYSAETLRRLGSNPLMMVVLEEIASLNRSIKTVEFRLGCNARQRAVGGIIYFGETEETLQALKNILATTRWDVKLVDAENAAAALVALRKD